MALSFKHSVALGITALFSLAATDVMAEDWGPYIGIKGGYSLAHQFTVDLFHPSSDSFLDSDDLDYAPFIGIAVGVEMPILPIRVELEATFRDNVDFEQTYDFGGTTTDQLPSIDSATYMLIGYIDIPMPIPLIDPYISAGIGVSRNETAAKQYQAASDAVENFSGKTLTEFSWTAGAGATFELFEPFVLDAGYRFVYLGDWDAGVSPSGGNIVGEYGMHEAYAALRYMF
ncbi:MAG: porin family protein [Magnetococcales bacterium]|nr:porin family protein [Magnetococcales bacterium]